MIKDFWKLVRRGGFVVLDTETTGLDAGEICQIAIIDDQGNPLINTLVKPVKPIPPDATAVHGIINAHVTDAPTWNDIRVGVLNAIRDKDVIIYNADYDYRMMQQSDRSARFPAFPYGDYARFHCAMTVYAEYYGDWNPRYQSYRWQKLSTACVQQGLRIKDAHAALGDCLMTLALIKKCAAADLADSQDE